MLLEAILAHLGAMLAQLGAMLAHLGAMLGYAEPSWRHLATTCRQDGAKERQDEKRGFE